MPFAYQRCHHKFEETCNYEIMIVDDKMCISIVFISLVMFTCLDLRDGGGVSVAERGDGQVEPALVVTLPEELLAHFEAPLPADLPRAAGVRNVCAFQSNLEH